MGEKSGFTNCVFEKPYVEKNRKYMKNCGLFLNMAKQCLWVTMSLRLSVMSVAPLYTAVVAQDHASSKTFTRLVTKAMQCSFYP